MFTSVDRIPVMPIPPEGEKLYPLKTLRQMVDVSHTVQQIHRWCVTGILNRVTKDRYYMDSVKIGQERHSSVEAFRRFCEVLSKR